MPSRQLLPHRQLLAVVLLTHEMPGAGGQEKRHGCEFGTFFSCAKGATPTDLLKRGIYSEIAVALKGGSWREASMAMLGMALGLTKEQAEAAAEGNDVLGFDLSIAGKGGLSILDVQAMRSAARAASRVSRASLVKGLSKLSSFSRVRVVTTRLEAPSDGTQGHVPPVDGASVSVQIASG